MKGKRFLTAMAAALCLLSAEGWAAPPQGQEKARIQSGLNLPDITAVPWTGDLDGMIERRIIRVLVPYSKTNYFVDKGTQYGLTYEIFRLFEDVLNKRLNKKTERVYVAFVPTSRVNLMAALLEGRGDIAASHLTITPERLEHVDFSNPTLTHVSEIVVTGAGAGPLGGIDDLAGKDVFVHDNTSYHESLLKLNARFDREGKPPVTIRPAPLHLEIEDLLQMVNAGLMKMTIADNHIAQFWAQVLPDIVLHPEAAVRTGGEIGFMIRKHSPLLKKELNAFIARYPEGSAARTQLLKRYLKSTRFVRDATSERELAKFNQVAEFFRKYGDRYGMDYLLMMAQGYQESRLDQNTRSPYGAIGVMQVKPETGKAMNVGDITQVEPNIHAGVKYIRFMVDQYYAKEPMNELNKVLFAFASYNAGPARISQFRTLTAKRGLNPNVWFSNVEMIAAEKIGRETLTYVANIYKYYIAYKLAAEENEARQHARDKMGKPDPTPGGGPRNLR